tara:strand:+ start:47967 stop:48767 length:801 start_codon:yes stop_codon:yes gene_type:complete
MNNDFAGDLWIVTDIDGTLMDHEYDLSPALKTLEYLKLNNIPVILCTSKTAAEVKLIRNNIANNDPYIIENGGAIYGSKNDSSEEWELVIGRSFNDLRPILDILSSEINYSLTALTDLSYSEVEKLTGLTGIDIELALDRKWSVPFLNPPIIYQEKLYSLLDKYDINIFQGNRMSHLLGKDSHKGKAVNKLKEYLDNPYVKIIALGDSPNDLPLLKIADEAIVVPGNNGPNKKLEKEIKNCNFHLAPAPHARGWAIAVNQILTKYL